jgi:hypothetical protein
MCRNFGRSRPNKILPEEEEEEEDEEEDSNN